MRKLTVLWLVVTLLLAGPVPVQAQSIVAFENLEIQFWPDYDQPAVLVIYDFRVTPETSLPALVSLRLPVGSQLLAVAKQENGSLVNVQYQLPERQVAYQLVNFSVEDRSGYHIEFYVPYVREGVKRSFTFTWPGMYAVKLVTVRLQEPVGATNVKVDPSMTRIGPEQDGFLYQTITLSDIPADREISFRFSYEKSDEALSTKTLGVQPTVPLTEPVSGQSSLMVYVPWILGGLGMALIVGGGIWYWISGRSSGSSRRFRRSRNAAQEPEGESQVYCAQCGKRAQASDRFCRACGSRLRSRE